MENTNQQPWTPYEPPKSLPVGKKELIFAVLAIFCGLILCNFTLFGGFSLGFAIGAVLCIGCIAGYLLVSGRKGSDYSAALLILSAVIAAGFARSDDEFVKFVMLCFLAVSVSLGLCLMAGRNRRPTAGITSLLDAPRAFITFGFEQASPALRGLVQRLRSGGPAIRGGLAVLAGLAIAVPLLLVMIPLLMSADAAFEGLIALLPEFNIFEAIVTAGFGGILGGFLFALGVGLRHKEDKNSAPSEQKRFFHPLMVNTALSVVSLLFLVYLFSQLAYFVGGFSGILPAGFTPAQYARRGFFEIAWLCAIDLGIIALSVGLVQKKEGKAPLSTRLLCLFIGIVTVFFVTAASAKMLLYIGTFGLTRLRLLTEIIMVFLGLATVTVCLWLFLPRLPYMKVLIIAALVMGAAVIWVDVDTVVANYNVSAYLDGRLETVDFRYLAELGDGAVPHIARLTDHTDPDIAARARALLYKRRAIEGDFRSWNFADWFAGRYL